MRHSRDLVSRLTTFVLEGIALAACGEPTSTGLPETSSPAYGGTGPSVLVCSTAEASTADAVVGPGGGSVSIGRTGVNVPPGAVTEPTRIAMTMPASGHAEVELRADGRESFRFMRPVLVTV